MKSYTYPAINNTYKYVCGLLFLKYSHSLSHVRNGATTIFTVVPRILMLSHLLLVQLMHN